jgi:predicted Zn-dependent protease
MTRVTLLVALIPWTALAQYSTAQDSARNEALGKQLAQEVERQATVIADPAIVEYVNRVAQNVARAAGLQQPLTVKVISGDSSYAFPGASCYVSSKLMLTAASEAELAGAIAHLLGHLALWHESHTAQNAAQIPIVWAADCLRLTVGGFALPMVFVDRQASYESQADQLGLGYLDKAGYDPGGLADFFERMLAQVHKPAFFRPWGKFPASTRAQADSLRAHGNNFVVTTSEFAAVQQRVSALAEPPVRADAPRLNRERLAPEVEHDVKLVRDPAIVDYVNRVGQKLAVSALRPPLTVKVIAAYDVHAITLPDSIVYLTTKLMLTAASEAELAGAIAHQLGHIADARGRAAGSNGLCQRVAGAVSAPGDAEEQADLAGIEYMDKAGYDPAALADFYDRILPPGGVAASTRARADALGKGRALVLTTSEFRDVQQRLMALSH